MRPPEQHAPRRLPTVRDAESFDGVEPTRADARSAAPFVTRLVPSPRKGRAPSAPRGAFGKDPRGLRVVGARGFEPPASCSQNHDATVGGGVYGSQPSAIIQEFEGGP